MIDGELRPIVVEFIAEMLNDPNCESVLLDVGEDSMVGSDLPVLYMDVIGKRYGCTLSGVGGEYSATIRNSNTNETITTMRGREGAWGLRELFAGIKTKLWGDK